MIYDEKRCKIERFYKDGNYKGVIDVYENTKIKSYQLNDTLYSKITVSYFRLKMFEKAVLTSKNIDTQYLNIDYLINEVLAGSHYFLNDIDKAFEYSTKAIDIKPSLKSAWQMYIVLKKRMNYDLSELEVDKAFKVAKDLKRSKWLRELSYLYYSLGNFKKSNLCINLMSDYGESINFIDQLTYSLMGIDKSTESIPASVLRKSQSSFINKKYINNNGNNKLVVTISPHAKLVLQSYKFSQDFDLLHIGDETASYYTFIYKQVATLISNLIIENNYEKLTLVGTSKVELEH